MFLNRTGKRLKEIRWDTPVLDMDSFKIRAMRMPSFWLAFHRDRTEYLEEFISHRLVVMHANAVLELVGRTGSGKSYSGLALSAYIDPEFDVKDCVRYSLNSILEEADTRNGICWMLDEVERLYGLGTWRSQSEWSNYIESIRKKQHSVITCTPEPKPMGTTMFTLEPLRISRADDVCHLAIMDADRQYLGYVMISHPKEFIGQKAVNKYEKAKDKYLESILKRDKGDNIGSMADAVLDNYEFTIKMTEKGFRKVSVGGEDITGSDLVEIVNEMFPYLNRNNECMAIAEAVKSRLFLRNKALLRQRKTA